MRKFLSLCLTGFLASACAGSGSSTAATTRDLVISEVGNALSQDAPAWLEIYNGSSSTVNLGSYALRAIGIHPTNRTSAGPTIFALPSLDVPPGAYAVVAGKTDPDTDADGPLYVHVTTADGRVPSWYGSGFVELLKGGATVDFVRFGSDSTSPVTPGMWSGGSATEFPTSDSKGGAPFNYALARRPVTATTHTAADWQRVTFATPGGPNDVEPGARDSDGDGVPDSAKRPGGTFAGLDLYAMGARPGQRDVFIEVDAMQSDDPGVAPQLEALRRVADRFRSHGIYLHIDAGNRYASSFDPARFHLGQKVSDVPLARCVLFYPWPGCDGNFFTYKSRYMDVARRGIFHYALFGSSQWLDGSRGSAGSADLNGPNFLITLGGWGLSTAEGAPRNMLVNLQASYFMHEFGHNLGLPHGGDELVNFKPNYFSIMNYLYVGTGLPDVTKNTVGDRYFYENYGSSPSDLCQLEASPCGDPENFRMDFSDGTSPAIDQENVKETVGIGRVTPYIPIDFNNDGVIADGYRQVLNPSNAEDFTFGDVLPTLRDHDDWSNLTLPFQTGDAWVFGSPSYRAITRRRSPAPSLADHSLDMVEEWTPSQRFFDSIQEHRTR